MLGELDDVIVAKIIATGATTEELAEAHAWLANDEPLMNAARPLPSGRVARWSTSSPPSPRRTGRSRKAGAEGHRALATMTVIAGGRRRFETWTFDAWAFEA
jgi:hypothetical protein